MKFKNCSGLSGKFLFGGTKYSFKGGVFECNKNEKDLIKFLKASSAWADYVPTAEDKVKEYDKVIEGLTVSLDEATKANETLKAENEALIEDLDEATKAKK